MKCFQFVVVNILLLVGVSLRVEAKLPSCSTPGLIGGPDTLCAEGSIMLTDVTAGGLWSSANSIVATVGSIDGVVTGVSGGATVITYSVAGGCYVTRQIFVKTIMPITGTTQICVGSGGSFSDLSLGGTWSSGSSSVANINAVTGAEDGLVAGITAISYTIANGCTVTLQATVNALPPNNYVFGGGDFCAGTSGATIGLDGSDTGINYILYNGSAYIDSQYGNGSALFYGPYTTAGTYQIYGVNTATGCTSRMSGIAIIGVIPDNVPSVSISTEYGDTVCIAASTTFTATPVNAGGSPTYQWYVNYVSMGTGNTFNYTPMNGDIVTVVIGSNAVCAIPATASSSITMTTIPSVQPSVNISVLPGDTVCEHVPVTIVPTPVYGGPSPAYKWVKNGIVAATGPVYSYMPVSGDNIFCSIYSDYQCLVTDSAYSNNVNVVVEPLLIPTLTVTAWKDTLREGQSDTVIAHVLNGGTNLSYQWEINGVAVPGATEDTFTSSIFSGIDTVTCVVTSPDFCGAEPAIAYIVIDDTDTVATHLATSAMFLQKGGITVWPNPNRGTFSLDGGFGSAVTQVTIEVMDMVGQVVYRQTTPLQQGKLNTQITLGSQLANGLYLIHFVADGDSRYSKEMLSR